MGCAKCGGRMLTKVGRKRPMLICSDCGHPISEADVSERGRRRLGGSLIMVALAAISGMTFFVTQMRRGPGMDFNPMDRMDRHKEIFNQ